MSIVGTLPVEHSVDPNGSLNLNVPIKVPPAKLSPDISVFYHSAITEMSVLGVGWELQAFGIIQRTGATIAQDGFSGTVNYNADDRYTVNGQRVIAISNTEYRTEIDQWSKIVPVGSDYANPGHWIEYLPDGDVRLYGSTMDSNIKATGQTSTRIWALAEIRDPFGNYASYSYTTDAGFPLLESITYGGNRTLNLAHQRKVTFSYENRTDVRTEFVGGSAVVLNKRLASISSFFDGALVSKHAFDYGGNSYAPVTGASRLKSITLSDPSGASVLPLTFNWNDASTSVFDRAVTLNSLPANTAEMQILPIDVSGSGRTDVVVASKQYDHQTGSYVLSLDVHLADGMGNISPGSAPGSGPTKLDFPHQLLAVDINGDGRTDLLHIFKDEFRGQHILTVILSTTDKGYVPQTPVTFGPPVLDGTYYTGDFEGNGYIGLAYMYNDNSGGLNRVCLKQFTSDGSSFTELETVFGPDGVDLKNNNAQVVIADFDGNGASDVFLLSPTYSGNTYVWQIEIFESQKGVLKYRNDRPFASAGAGIEVAAHSAFLSLPEQDGKTGLFLVSQSHDGQGYLQYRTLRSTGKSFSVSGITGTEILYQGKVNVGQTASMSSLDLVNVVHLYQGQTQVSVLHFHDGKFVDVEGITQPPNLQGYDVNFVDLRGVGRTDCLFSLYDQISNNLVLSSLPSAENKVAPPDYIVGFKGGLGATLDVVYAPLTDSTVYTTSDPTSATGPANPYVNALSRTSSSHVAIDSSGNATSGSSKSGSTRTQLMRFPKYVVKHLTSTTQPGVESTAEYFYENARVSFDGRGWLGFESVTQKSSVLRTATRNWYKQEFPFVGQMWKTDTQDVSDAEKPAVLKNVTYDWKRHDTGHGTKKTQCYTTMPSVTQTSYEKGRESYFVNTLNEYDDYANLTRSTITTAGKPDLIIAQTYQNLDDNDKWIIGSGLSESVTSNASLVRQTDFTYLPGTQAVNKTTKWVSNSSSILEQLSYDGAGNVTKSTGPAGAEQTFDYDWTYSFPVKVTTAVDATSSLTTSATYDYGVGEVKSQTQYNGFITKHKYDVLGRVVESSEGESDDKMTVIEKREYKYLNGNRDPVCVRSTLCDSVSQSWSSETEYLDGMERAWKKAVVNPSSESETVYSQVDLDGAGRAVKEYRNYTSKATNPAVVVYSYDGLSRKTKAVFPPVTPDSSAITVSYNYEYDNNQHQTVITETKSGDGTTTSTKTVLEYFQNPESGSHQFVVPLTVASIDELEQTVTTVFDALHRAITTKDPSGVCLSQEWDGISRLTSRMISNPEGIQPREINHFFIAYDDVAGAKTITNQCTSTNIVFLQDRLGRLTKRTAPDDATTYMYDDVKAKAQGQLYSIESSSGVSEAFSYDPRGSLQTSSLMIDGQTFKTAFEYTTGYVLSKITNPDQSVHTNTFFNNSNLVKQVELQDGRSKTTSVSCAFSNFDNGFLAPRVSDMGNGLASTATLADNGVPLKAVLSKGSTALIQQTWDLDSYGRLEAYNPSSSLDTVRKFAYNRGGQLAQSQSHQKPSVEYKYDKSGNILSRGGDLFKNEGWQLTSITDSSSAVISSFEYTPDGHRSKEKNGAGEVLRTMTYDSLGRMTAVNSTKFVYDSRGRMVKANRGDSVTYYPSTSYEVTVHGNTTSQTAYLVHQSRRASISTNITSGGDPSEPSVQYYHGDHLGSVIAVSDKDGEIQAKYLYDDHGVASLQSGSDISRYKYSGKEEFEGLYYFGARFYDPKTGRFTSTDKIAFSLELITVSMFNQYTFSRNDPVNFIDFNGDMSFWWHLLWHVVVDVALIVAGVAATILLPEVPMLGSMLIGAGISGLQYDGEAAFNAVVFKNYEISDANWGISLGIGAALGAFEGLGGFKYAGKLASKLSKGSGLTKVAAKVGTKFGVGPSVGKYTVQQVQQGSMKTIAKSVAKSVGKGAWGIAKEVGKGVGTQVGKKMLDNVMEGNNIWEGVGKEALDGVVTGVIGGVSNGVLNSSLRSFGPKNLGSDITLKSYRKLGDDMTFRPEANVGRRGFDSLMEGKSGFF